MLNNTSNPPCLAGRSLQPHKAAARSTPAPHTALFHCLADTSETAAKPNTQRDLHLQMISSQQVPLCKRFQLRKPLRRVELQ